MPSDVQRKNCPFCGQPLVNAAAIQRLQRSQAEFRQRLQREASQKAAQQTRARLDAAVRKARAEASADLRAANARTARAQRDASLAARASKQRISAAVRSERARMSREVSRAQARAARTEKEAAAVASRATREHRHELDVLRRSHAEALKDVRDKMRDKLENKVRKEITADSDKREKELRGAVAKLKEQNQDLERRLEHMTASDRGSFAEADLVRALQQHFPEDDVQQVGRGRRGADVLQVVRYKVGDGFVQAGLIVYECKDTQTWQNAFLEQVQGAKTLHGASFAVLVSKAFPRAQRELCWREGVVIVHPARAIHLVQVLRRMIILISRAGLSKEDQAHKVKELYEYLRSERFKQTLAAICATAADLGASLRDETQWHERTWARREKAYRLLSRTATQIDESIAQIVERPARRPEAKAARMTQN